MISNIFLFHFFNSSPGYRSSLFSSFRERFQWIMAGRLHDSKLPWGEKEDFFVCSLDIFLLSRCCHYSCFILLQKLLYWFHATSEYNLCKLIKSNVKWWKGFVSCGANWEWFRGKKWNWNLNKLFFWWF